MSSYIDGNLMPNETVIKKGLMHWFIFAPGCMLLILGLTLTVATQTSFGSLFFLVGIFLSIKAALSYVGTELAVTNKRVIAKFGFIRRSSIELNHNNVESFKVDQSVLGRILNFGTIHINGTGGVSTPIPSITNPLEFRRTALEIIEPNEV